MSLPFIGVQDEHGHHLHIGNPEIGLNNDIRSSFLIATAPYLVLQVEIIRFDFHRQAELQDHLQVSSPIASRITQMLQEGILSCVKGIY